VVLSLGLIDRTLALRSERDSAQRLAERDSLTGLLNRRAWTTRVEALVEHAFDNGHHLTLLFLDLDHFKSLNDCHGHAAGDAALTRVAETLRRTLRPGDIISRFGGEEFVAALPDCAHEGAHLIAERVRAGIAGLKIPIDANGRQLTASIGVATLRHPEKTDSLLARADRAMYAAKSSGRNRVVFAD
jgi:diguanylate cyclase (GGDEF)-like protein